MSSCIYCGSTGPFNSEHVFPYSLGGGGNGWTLTDCVCEECNNSFSSLERSLARNSLESLPRTAFGPVGRKRGKVSGNQLPLRAEALFYLPEDSPYVYESGIGLGFKGYLRPQMIHTTGNEVQILGPSSEEINKMISLIEDFLQHEKCLVTNVPSERGGTFESALLGMEGNKAIVLEKMEDIKPPQRAAWLCGFPDNLEEQTLTTRFFVDDDGKLNIRAENIEQSLWFIGMVAQGFSEQKTAWLDQIASAPVRSTGPNVSMTIRQALALVSIYRAIAKIAVNITARIYGEEYVRGSQFNEIKKFIRGEIDQDLESVHKYVRSVKETSPFQIFKTDREHHYILLKNVKGTLVCVISFYGSGGYMILLGSVDSQRVGVDLILIDYSSRETHLVSPEELPYLMRDDT